MIDRNPYYPPDDEWADVYRMLCGQCDRQLRCDIIEGMIALKDGGAWPEGGWVTDPGAGVTCLSYQPKPMQPLSRQRLRLALRKAMPMCSGCAAQKGSDASVSLHTRRDFAAAVRARAMFLCHQPGREGKPCGGWCQAIQRQVRRD